MPNVPLLKAALARGLRVLASAVAEAVGPSNGPLRTYAPELRAEAKAILNYLLQVYLHVANLLDPHKALDPV